MKQALYEVIFEVSVTCNNGNERRIRKGVLIPRFDETTGRHIPPEKQIERGTKALQEAQYYNVVYVETKNKILIFG